MGPGDRFIAETLAGSRVPVVIAVNKVDRLDRPRTVLALTAAASSGSRNPRCSRSRRAPAAASPLWWTTSPACCRRGRSTSVRRGLRPARARHARRARARAGAASHAPGGPHAVEVQVDEITEQHDLVIVRAFLWVETESQKGILIGARPHDQVDRHGGTARARARARQPRASRPVGARAVMARRRVAARPPRDHLACRPPS